MDRSQNRCSGQSSPATDDNEGFAVERNGTFVIALVHLFAAFAVPKLLWDTETVGDGLLTLWSIIQVCLGLMALASIWCLQQRAVARYAAMSFGTILGTAATFGALPWLGGDIAAETPSRHVLLIALFGATSISVARSSPISRRRAAFVLVIASLGVSYTLAFGLQTAYLFAGIALIWCTLVGGLTVVGYRGVAGLLERQVAREKTARHDGLTGLLSRSTFFDALQGMSASAPQPSSAEQQILVLFDLDGFKAINDSFGHEAGDAALRIVAKRLRTSLPMNATIGRLGGDEFGAALTSQRALVPTVVDRALLAVSEQLTIGGRELYVAASAGWTTVTRGVDAVDLLAEADAAISQSKNSQTTVSTGFDDNLRAELDRSLDVRQRFRAALKRHEIVYWAQPMVRTSDRVPVAIELLARWPEDDDSMIGPMEFTRIAGETGLAVELDRQALVAAATLLGAWQDDATLGSITVKVNVSPVHLHGGELIESVRSLVPAPLRTRLGIELVETDLVSPVDDDHAQLRDLREMGVTVSIDDFGVGYSSLAYLRDLPVSELKIDRSFITNLDTDAINQGLVRAIESIASTLGLPTVAEGVETEAEFAAVASLGISLAQGYLLARASPVADVADDLRRLADAAQPPVDD